MSEKHTAERCKGTARDTQSFRGVKACSRRATKDGYCSQHHPDAVSARRDKSTQAWKADLEKRRTKAERELAQVRFTAGIPTKALEETTLAEVVGALKGTVRIINAYRYTAGLGKGQTGRLETAKALLAKLGDGHDR